jgi:hypothetical protein
MSYSQHIIEQRFEEATENLNRGAEELDLDTLDGYEEFQHLLMELKLVGSISSQQLKAEHDIMSGAIQAVK